MKRSNNLYINVLKCGPTPEDSNVTVTLTYYEIRDIANTCYYAKKYIPANQKEVNKAATSAANKTKFLFDMIKHGNIQAETIDQLYEERKSRKSK